MKIEKQTKNTGIGIIAIHGGKYMEPGTDECAKLIAGNELSFCVVDNEMGAEHITSTKYRQPEVLEFVKAHHTVVSVHGEKTKNEKFVIVGGLDEDLKPKMVEAIQRVGYEAWIGTDIFPATNPDNICNLCRSGKGVQLEMSNGLRHYLWQNADKHQEFVDTIRKVLQGIT